MQKSESGVQLKPSRAKLEIKSETPDRIGVSVDMQKGTTCAISAIGECFELPLPVFEALSRCLSRDRRTAKVTLEFRNGGCAGVDFAERLKG